MKLKTPDGIDIIVKDIRKNEDGTFSGTIHGFKPPVLEFKELKTDNCITFKEEEVYGW